MVSSRRLPLRSGTQNQSSRLTATVAATISMKASRHDQTRSSSSSGTVTVIAPIMPTENAIAFMVESRSAGYQSTKAVSDDMRRPTTPTPISARAAIAPAAAIGIREPRTARRGDEEQRGVHAARTEAVHRHAERQLADGEGEEVHARQQAEPAGGEAELGGQRRARAPR